VSQGIGGSGCTEFDLYLNQLLGGLLNPGLHSSELVGKRIHLQTQSRKGLLKFVDFDVDGHE